MRAFVISSLLAITACASGVASRSTEQSEAPSVITVENQRTEDATIYVSHAGTKARRLGRVASLTTETFELKTGDLQVGSNVQFLALSFANGATDLSDPITAELGVRYRWQLAPGRGHQFIAAFRYASADGTTVVRGTQ